MNLENISKSYLTGYEVESTRNAMRSTTYYRDPICGKYAINDDNKNLNDKTRIQIAKVLATRNLRFGENEIHITDNNSTFEGFTNISVDELLNQYPSTVVSIFDEALINLSHMLDNPSDTIEITDDNMWYIFAHDPCSTRYILHQLAALEYISSSIPDLHTKYKLNIIAKGWERLKELKENRADSTQCFVAMWFADEMSDFYNNGIAPAIQDAGFTPRRIDAKEHNNKICDEIVAEIKRSRFVIADFTGQRGGVYYEAGFAHGLNIPVIWTVREDHLGDVHFDTRQYNHIVYDSPEDLREKLSNRIKATII